MLGTTLFIIVAGGDAEQRSEQATQRVREGFADTSAPQTKVLTAAMLLEQPIKPVCPAAAWLLLDESCSDDEAYDLIETLSDHHVPTAIARPGMTEAAGEGLEDGGVACPADADPAVLKATLSTMLGMAATMQSLSREIKVLQAQSDGMAGQFDKIDEELRMALKIQREFLPKQLPELDGLKFDVLWRPACYVGGDIYDVVRLDEEHIGVFIADAVGHGMPAALMTIFIKQATRMRQITPGIGAGYRIVPPGEALAGLNKAMIQQDAGAASLGTAAYGIINTQTQRLTIARAGHPAPLLLRGNGATQWLEPDGAMLGILPDEVFEELTFDLDDGDRFLLYSDGFEVAFPGCGGKGKLANDHYAQEFEGLRRGTGQQALDYLQSRLDLQSGSLNQRDDLTVVTASVEALADVQANRAAYDEPRDRRSVA
ncbi:MAG: PP2C family protein-serine/threonine phosphatase [Planctomycetota bacterium]